MHAAPIRNVRVPTSCNPLSMQVCSRWRTVYDTSIIWADIELDWGGRVHHATAICTWMLKRAPLLQQLTYTGCYMSAALDAHLVQLLKQAPRLVSITLLDVGQKIDAAVGHLRHATALRSLTIAPHTPQRGMTTSICT